MKSMIRWLSLALLFNSFSHESAWAAPQEVDASSKSPEICVGVGAIGARIVVGRTDANKVTIIIPDRGGTCNYKQVHYDGLSGLIIHGANFSSQTGVGEQEDIFVSSDCPTLAAQMAKRQPSKERGMHDFRGVPSPAIQIGLFTVTDFGGYFDLQSAVGRREAANWIEETLAAARACWEWRDGDPNPLLQRLYGDVGIRAPSLILSPEAKARQVEDRQLRVAISSQPPSRYQSRLMLASEHRSLNIEDIIIDYVERLTKSPDANISLTVKVKNIGTAPVDAIWARIDLSPFLEFGDHSLAQRKENACEELGELSGNDNLATQLFKPNDRFFVHVKEKTGIDFRRTDNDEAYGDNDADFITAVGCLKYSREGAQIDAPLTFAFVIGKIVNGDFVRLSRQDILIMTKNLKVFNLN